jgi:SAM-dependent methyltransferase
MSNHQTLGKVGFPDGKTYEAGRPGYPAAAVEFLAQRLGIGPGRDALDLGAGTGKFTRELLRLGARVVAVEPSAPMLAELVAASPGVDARSGTGEAIPAPDASFDLVIAAQAFHWFDAPRALAEIARVLRGGGGLGLIWNERDESVPWVHELSLAMQWDRRQPYRVGMDFRPVIATSPAFEQIERHSFRHAQTLDRAALRSRVASTSYIAAMSEAERAALFVDVDARIDALSEPITLPYLTEVYVARRR